MKSAVWALLIPTVVLACESGAGRTGIAGEMRVEWNGSTDGRMSAPATATWCELRRLLEIRSIQGDTGIALAVYPTRRRIAGGAYRVVEPSRAESVPPAAGVAMRWLTRNVVQGFQGDSGELRLERSGTGQLSGQVQARARSVVDTQRVTLIATFKNLTPRTDTLACVLADTTAEAEIPDDTGEEGESMVN